MERATSSRALRVSRRARIAPSLFAFCAALPCGCRDAAPPPPNIVLVVVDTLRADRTTLHGYERETTPQLAAWATGGTVFERAQAASSWTVPSMAMLLTGRYRVGGGRSLGWDGEALGSTLSRAGYRTIGIVANPVLNELQGFTEGYESYDLIQGREDATDPLHIGSWTAQLVVKKALRWLRVERDDEPFLLYLHLMDPHHPYEPDEIDAFDWSDAATPARRALYNERLASAGAAAIQTQELRAVERQQALYDAEVLQVDRGLGELFAYLESSGLDEHTIVILTSDHGEGLWQRSSMDGWVNTGRHENQLIPELYRGHGEQLYEELVHVPLVFRGPGVPAGRRDARPTSLIDVYPTLFALLDLAPPAGLQGRDLFSETPPARDDLYSHCSRGTTITEGGRWKLHLPSDRILAVGASPVLYDLASDPLEEQPLADAAIITRLRAKVRAWTAINEEDTEELPIAAQRQLLLQMGYVGLAEDLDEDWTREEVRRAMKAVREARKALEGDRSSAGD